MSLVAKTNSATSIVYHWLSPKGQVEDDNITDSVGKKNHYPWSTNNKCVHYT